MAFKRGCGLEIFNHSAFRPNLPPTHKIVDRLYQKRVYRPGLPKATLLRPSLPAPVL